MGLKFLLLPIVWLSLTVGSAALANELEDRKKNAIALKLKLHQVSRNSESKLSRLRQREKFSTDAIWLTQKPSPTIYVSQSTSSQV